MDLQYSVYFRSVKKIIRVLLILNSSTVKLTIICLLKTASRNCHQIVKDFFLYIFDEYIHNLQNIYESKILIKSAKMCAKPNKKKKFLKTFKIIILQLYVLL